jgi:hypothetical protein
LPSRRKSPRLLTLAAAILLAGCATSPSTPPPPRPDSSTTPNQFQRLSDSARDGLEAFWWVVDDADDVLARRLHELTSLNPPADSPTIPAETIDRLQRLGFRAFVVPAQQALALQAQTPGAGPIQRRWMGQVVNWTVVVRGRERPASSIELPDGTLDLPPGRFRILARAWTIPSSSVDAEKPAALLQIDLRPQHEDGSRPAESALRPTDPTAPPTIESNPIEAQGVVFDRAALSASLAEGQALILIPEDPAADWNAIDAPSDTRGRIENATGPIPARPLSLGELALSDAQPGSKTRLKLVLVLVAHVPDQFSILNNVR